MEEVESVTWRFGSPVSVNNLEEELLCCIIP